MPRGTDGCLLFVYMLLLILLLS
uniref:Uncharacterized protein n=1 Tax=Arundo donax TaxID=35708 RepID=A0A0A9TH63_ARUDO